MPKYAFANRVFNSRMGAPAALQGTAVSAQPIATVRRITRLRPSYRNGFANRYDSEKPHLWRGLVAGWAPQLGPTGDMVRDFVGIADATVANHSPDTLWHATGRDQVMRFDAFDDCAEFQAGTALDGITSAVTVSCLYMFNGPTLNHLDNRGLFLKDNGSDTLAIRLRIDGSQPLLLFSLVVTGGSTKQATVDVGASPGIDIVNQWVRCTGTWDGTTIRLYVDRTEYDTTANTLAIDNGVGGGCVVGGLPGSINPETAFAIDGQWGGTYVWDRALSPSEIGELVDDPVCLLRRRVTWPGGAFQGSGGLENATDGWVADTRSRSWVSGSRTHAWSGNIRSKVWVAPNRNQEG